MKSITNKNRILSYCDKMSEEENWKPIEVVKYLSGWDGSIQSIKPQKTRYHLIQELAKLAEADLLKGKVILLCHSFSTWCTESRKMLMDWGIEPLNELARSGDDATPYHELFWDEKINQPQEIGDYTYFSGSNSPNILVIEEKAKNNECWKVSLYSISIAKDLHFRGCGLETNFPDKVKYVRKMYKGTLSFKQIRSLYLFSPPQKVEDIYGFSPKADANMITKNIRDKNLTKWTIHTCHMCGYECGYLFTWVEEELIIHYDSGCYCVFQKPGKRDMKDLLECINKDSSTSAKSAFESHRDFWGLSECKIVVKGQVVWTSQYSCVFKYF